MLSISHIKKRLRAHEPQRFMPQRNTRQAAVAVVLREGAGNCAETEILFIKRARNDGDPWSGHMAFPGGHREPQDSDLAATATRETHEEIGLIIKRSDLIGELSQEHAGPLGHALNMLVAPYVFQIDGNPSFDLNFEVDEAIWTALKPMHMGLNQTIENQLVSGTSTSRVGYRLESGHFVWGLTYRMIQSLFEVIDSDYIRKD